MKNTTQKISISLPSSLFFFVEEYKVRTGSNRSEVFEEALKLLEAKMLEYEYIEASKLQKQEIKALDSLSSDGLSHESW